MKTVGSYLIGFMVFMIALHAGQAQVEKSRFNLEVPNCYQVGYQMMRLTPFYYRTGEQDSLNELHNYYLTHCPVNDTYRHFELIQGIISGDFSASDYPDIFGLLMAYRDSRIEPPSFWDQPAGYREAWLKAYHNYHDFIQELAAEAAATTFFSELDLAVLNFYGGNWNSAWEQLLAGEYGYSIMQEPFDSAMSAAVFSDEYYIGLYSAVWLPVGNIQSLGIHPELGLKIGAFHRKMHYDFIFGFRFLDAPRNYSVRKNDSIYTDDYFLSTYVGLEVSRSLYRTLKNEIDLGIGVAYDGISFHSYGAGSDLNPETIRTLNLNVGLGYTYFYNTNKFIELELRYNYLNYRNNMDDGLSGNALSFRLTWAISDHTRRQKFWY